MQDGTKTTTSTNSENQTPKPKSEEKNRYGVYRLDIRTPPGWFVLQTYDNEQDANIYCDMLNNDTNMVHRVFMEDAE